MALRRLVGTAYDPDEDAILLQNFGSSPLTLTAASLTASNTGFNLFTQDSITGPVRLNPGSNVILAGVDGSDELTGLTTIRLTIGGINYSYLDVVTATAPNGVLEGANPFIGGAESIPWTAVNTVSEPSTWALLIGGVVGLACFARTGRCRQGRI